MLPYTFERSWYRSVLKELSFEWDLRWIQTSVKSLFTRQSDHPLLRPQCLEVTSWSKFLMHICWKHTWLAHMFAVCERHDGYDVLIASLGEILVFCGATWAFSAFLKKKLPPSFVLCVYGCTLLSSWPSYRSVFCCFCCPFSQTYFLGVHNLWFLRTI